MKSIHLLLNEAETFWRDDVRRDFPLRSDTPIIRQNSQNGRDWAFSTDLKKIYADISDDKGLRKKFETIITKYWDGKPEELARDTLHYLLHHELYRPIEAPFSVTGKDNDNKKIHQAIRRGVIQAEPKLSPLEQIVKVQSSQNGIKDFILDNRFALDNKEKKYVREDIIPTWDLLELQNSPSETNFYTITRFLYGVLYGPQSTHSFFEGKSGKAGVSVAEKALKSLINTSVELPKTENKSLVDKAKLMFSSKDINNDSELDERVQSYVSAIRKVFSGDDRYKGIERFIRILSPYIKKDMPKGRPSMQGAGSGTSPQSILQDLLDDMTLDEQQQFTQELSQENNDSLEQAAMQMEQLNDANSTKPESSDSIIDEMKNLDLLATHEFYKRSHPKVNIVGGKKVGESIVIGKQKYWNLKKSNVLTENQLSKINLSRINNLQKKTRLPWLINLGNNTYRLNEYELKERDIKDIVYVDVHIDVPDMVEFYLDSSGSMFNGDFKVDDGSRWDMLSHVLYGFVDALYQGGKKIRKETNMRIHNFGNSQVSSKVISVNQFWNGETKPLETLFKPNNGYSVEDINITNYNDNLQRSYVIVTDGDLVISNRTNREAKKMKEISKNSNNNVVLFEIGGTYDLGNAIKNDPNISYHTVDDKDKMLQAGLDVLLSKREETKRGEF